MIHTLSGNITVAARVMPIKNNQAQNNISQWIKYIEETPPDQVKSTNDPSIPYYVTVFGGIDPYQQLSRSLNDSDYASLLLALNEINAIVSHERITSELYNEITTSQQFTLGILRSPLHYKGFRFGFHLARRVLPPYDSRSPFTFTAKLAGFETPHSVNFRYKESNIFSGRVHCLVGINGVGKTRYLAELTSAIAARLDAITGETKTILRDVY